MRVFRRGLVVVAVVGLGSGAVFALALWLLGGLVVVAFINLGSSGTGGGWLSWLTLAGLALPFVAFPAAGVATRRWVAGTGNRETARPAAVIAAVPYLLAILFGVFVSIRTGYQEWVADAERDRYLVEHRRARFGIADAPFSSPWLEIYARGVAEHFIQRLESPHGPPIDAARTISAPDALTADRNVAALTLLADALGTVVRVDAWSPHAEDVEITIPQDAQGSRSTDSADRVVLLFPVTFAKAGSGAVVVRMAGRAIESVSIRARRSAALAEAARAIRELSLATACRIPGYMIGPGRVYWYGTEVEGADPQSFTCVEGTALARDAHRVYRDGEPLPGVDGGSFQLLSAPDCRGPYYRDAANVYDDTLRPIEGADPKTFALLSAPGREACVGRDARHVFWSGRMIAGADPSTFALLGNGFAHDRAQAYRHGAPLPPGGQQQFDMQLLGLAGGAVHAPAISAECRRLGFDAAGGRVYWNGQVVPEADPTTFACLEGTGFASDARHVYRFNDLIPDVDGATFRSVTAGACRNFFRDQRRVYDRNLAPLGGADPNTFTALSGFDPAECWDVGRDARHVFWRGRVLEGADPATFTLLSHGFAYDVHRPYRDGAPLAPGDRQQYEILRVRESVSKRAAR